MIIKIDTNKYVTPRQLAKELGYDQTRSDCTQRISNWIARGKVTTITIPELNDLILIERATIPAHASK